MLQAVIRKAWNIVTNQKIIKLLFKLFKRNFTEY